MQHLGSTTRLCGLTGTRFGERRRNRVLQGLEAAGFVVLISLALPAAASLGILVGTGLAP